ncbi:hypothetical protein K438DRAFT_1997682 [Mycena galopus ATCC 62051]|nr:hypothetical protein K438DRAFT_1997682 [Mycena galopus ATCC 62051]
MSPSEPLPPPAPQLPPGMNSTLLPIQTSLHSQIASTDSHSDNETLVSPQPISSLDEGDQDANETTPFLPGRRVVTRPRSESHPSVFSSVSVAPSLAQTVVSLFRTYDDDEEFGPEGGDDGLLISAGELPEVHSRPEGFWSLRAWRRYFRPLTRKVYYRSLFHLYVVNFPFALAAFLFAVVFTVTGTTLLVALPSTHIHRVREVNAAGVPVPETSFYKNTYAMFTDPTSYQALFYFLVIKPSITLLLSLGLLVVGIPAIVLVGPAPLAFRAIRNLGIWQANVAVEGLYLAVR